MLSPALGLVVVAALLAQAGAAALREAPPNVVVRVVVPGATDPRIDTFSGNGWEHCVYFRPGAETRRQLLVFLPGTGGNGHGARGFCTLAANLGYHVVSVAYPNEVSVSTLRASPNPDAFLRARENVLYGVAPFGRFAVDPPNSILNRLVRLIGFLSARFPREGWGGYLGRDGLPVWEKVVVAGHSQGGGHAALLAVQHPVARVLLFGSPKDFNVAYEKPARWYYARSATPVDRYFSFVHSADEGHGCTYRQQLANYRALRLLPRYPVVDVDVTPPPYRHTRLLTSSRPQEVPHASVIKSPQDYRRAWVYMLEEPAEQ